MDYNIYTCINGFKNYNNIIFINKKKIISLVFTVSNNSEILVLFLKLSNILVDHNTYYKHQVIII